MLGFAKTIKRVKRDVWHIPHLVTVRLTLDECESVYDELGFKGYVIAYRRGRDAADDVHCDLVAGQFSSNGGSIKNPHHGASDDCVFELVVPQDCAELHKLNIVDKGNDDENPLAIYSTETLKEELARRVPLRQFNL